jgi:hypothetical protein
MPKIQKLPLHTFTSIPIGGAESSMAQRLASRVAESSAVGGIELPLTRRVSTWDARVIEVHDPFDQTYTSDLWRFDLRGMFSIE